MRMLNRVYYKKCFFKRKSLNRVFPESFRKISTFKLIDDPEDVDAGDPEVDPAEDAAFFALDVVQEEDERVEQIVAS